MLQKTLRHPILLIRTALILAALLPALPFLHSAILTPAHATAATHQSHHPQLSPIHHHSAPAPRHIGPGVDRTHLPAIPVFSGQSRRATANAQHTPGAFIGSNENPNNTKTLFFDNMENGAPGWTTQGDNNGHSFWSLINNPDTLTVPGAVNPLLVSYPDTAGKLPAAHSGTHAWWYGDNPANDPQPATASMTYMGNETTWPSESSHDGGTSNGPNSASLMSPTIDLTSVHNATLSFATWWEIEGLNPAHFDQMYLDITTNNGSTWTSLGVLNPTTNPLPTVDYPFSNPGGPYAYPYTNNGLDVPASWHNATANLTSYIGHKVQLRFRFDTIDQTDNGFRGWFIDDVGVYTTTGKGPQPRVNTVTPNIGFAGTPVTIMGTGFGAQQQHNTVTFNGVNALVQSWGNYQIVAIVPTGITSGPLVVTVKGVQTPAINFTINASVNFGRPIAPAGGYAFAMRAQGFIPAESVAIYIDGVNGILMATANADNTGTLVVNNLHIPDVPFGIHLVLTVGQKSQIIGGFGLLIYPYPSIVPDTLGNNLVPNQVVQLVGHGYAPYDTMQVSLQSQQFSYNLGSLPCNGNGDCQGQVTIPYNPSPGPQGTYYLAFLGQISGLDEGIQITLSPVIILYPIKLGAGSYLSIYGAAFNPNETVQVYLGSTSGTLEGTPTTDSNGGLNFYFQLPTTIKPGFHLITVVRSGQSPSTVVASFQVVPPKMVSTPGIHSGQPIQAHLSGFQSNEYVTISWNANGGQNLYAANTDQTGSWSGSFTPPTAPAGSYTLTALGSSSGFQATCALNVGPGILLNPNPGAPNATLTVTGGAFTSGETVKVYFQQPKNAVSATVASDGTFTASLTIPLHYDPSVSYYVYAVSATGKDHARALFAYVAPQLYVFPQTSYGGTTPLDGQGFAANEQVTFYWLYGQQGQVQVGAGTAASDGTVSITITVPSEPNLGIINVAAIGATSHLKAITSTQEYPGLILQPPHAPVGATVNVNGGSFASNETVTVTLNGSPIATATTDSTGAFTTTFVVPNNLQGGNQYPVQATGNTSGATAQANLTVDGTLTLTPNSGPSGTPITVTGTNFTNNEQGQIYWYDPSNGNTTQLGSFTASNTGAFTANITAPQGLISGHTYDVEAFPFGPYGANGSAPFLAQ